MSSKRLLRVEPQKSFCVTGRASLALRRLGQITKNARATLGYNQRQFAKLFGTSHLITEVIITVTVALAIRVNASWTTHCVAC